MAQQIVGFYSDRHAAEQVQDELVNAGFGRSDVKIFSGHDGPSFWDEVKDFFGLAASDEQQLYAEAARRGATAVAVHLDESKSSDGAKAVSIMERYNPVDLDQRSEQWRAEGWQSSTGASHAQAIPAQSEAIHPVSQTEFSTATPVASDALRASDSDVLPVAEEQLKVGKREVQRGGIRVHSHVIEKPVEEQVQLRQEHVNVERRPVDRPVTAGDQVFQERTIEATETVEEPVVSKEARVVEEVVLNKDVEQTTQTVRDTVRRSDVDVEQVGAGNPGQSQFRPDQFVAELSRDQRFHGRDWDTLEPEARQSFEQRYPGSKWEQFKDAIHRGYDKVREKV